MTIPKVLHRIVLPPMKPRGQVEDYWQRLIAMHPQWGSRTWSSADPKLWPEVGHLLPACRTPAQKADLIRLDLLWRVGGVYVDTDCEPVSPLDPLVEHGCFLGREISDAGDFLGTAVIGAEPGHPAIRAYLDAVLVGFDPERPPNESTGPHLADRVLRDRPDVTVLPPAAFFPEPWIARFDERRVTTDELAVSSPETFLVHRWAMTWHPPEPPRWRRKLRQIRSGLHPTES